MKKILLLMVAALFLCGVTSAQNWGTPDSHAKSSNTPIVAKVTLGETVQGAGTLGAFVGDSLRGLATIHTDGNFWIQAFYNEGETNPDEFTFKFYDGTQEYTNCTTTLPGQEEGYGTPNSPVELVFANEQTMTQTTALADGWAWWSTPIELSGINGLQMLENSLGTSGVRIQSKSNGYVDRFDYNGNSVWFGTLNSLVNEQMYMVHANSNCNATMTGTIASVAQHPITISNGWNWIGFPSMQSMSVTNAMAGFIPEANDQIKSKNNGFTTYVVYGSGAMWFGTLNTLEPGQGYMYLSNSSSPKTLLYQSASKGDPLLANITSNNNTFLPNDESYAYNMTVTAIVELEGNELRSSDYELAAFVNNHCRGSVKLLYIEPLDRYLAFLLISGENEENISFALTDGNEVSWSNDRLMFNIDGIVGSPTEPAILHFGPLGISEDGLSVVNVYPNPSKDVFNIEGNNIKKIEVINALGQIVISKEVKEDNLQIDLSNNAIGVYVLRVITNNGITTKQLIKNN